MRGAHPSRSHDFVDVGADQRRYAMSPRRRLSYVGFAAGAAAATVRRNHTPRRRPTQRGQGTGSARGVPLAFIL